MSEGISDTAFREALAQFASGVTVVTARGAAGPVGFTASAFTSVSLRPPLVLVCVAKGASAHDTVVKAELFGVSVLADRQAWIAEQFARARVDRFDGVPLRVGGEETIPFIEGALVHLACASHAVHDAGDHTVLLGEVLGASVSAGRPLVHFARQFGGFLPETGLRTGSLSERASNERNRL
jgi:flavin reductase ActVB